MKFDETLQANLGITLNNMAGDGDPLVDERLRRPIESIQRGLLDIVNSARIDALGIGRV
jgi:hypothetical protein